MSKCVKKYLYFVVKQLLAEKIERQFHNDSGNNSQYVFFNLNRDKERKQKEEKKNGL